MPGDSMSGRATVRLREADPEKYRMTAEEWADVTDEDDQQGRTHSPGDPACDCEGCIGPLTPGSFPTSGRVLTLPDHAFWPVNGHPDDDECTHRQDGTDATYCGLPQRFHSGPRRVECDRCTPGMALYVVRCYLGCWHAQCLGCAEQTEREALAERVCAARDLTAPASPPSPDDPRHADDGP